MIRQKHGMYVVEMAFAVILMSFSGGDDISIHFNEFFSAQDDMAHQYGMIRQNTECMWWRWHLQ